MAIYRAIQMSFWTDSKIVENFSPAERYFYLYLFTNPHTNLAGCYEISINIMAMEMGYGKDTISGLIDNLENTHNVIRYSRNTKEVLILNWHKYNWTGSEKFRKPLKVEIDGVKNDAFRDYLIRIYNGEVCEFLDDTRTQSDTVSIPYRYRTDTTVSVTVSDNNTLSFNDSLDNQDIVDTRTNTVNKITLNNLNSSVNMEDVYIEIIDYLNSRVNARYRWQTKYIQEYINARLKEGFTIEDFKTVIDKKCEEWLGTEMEKFLRPQTLFAPSHFQEYLYQLSVRPKTDVERIFEA